MARLTRTQVALGAAGVAGAVYIGNWLWRSPAVRFARMAGSSLAAPDAVGWVTDFLNAAYYRRPAGLRQVDDLRLAFCVITTYWHRHGHRRLRLYDVLAFDRAFGVGRFLDMRRSPWGMLNREQLFEGAARLLGAWFPAAYLDDRRRGWGIAFETDADRARYHPEVRLRAATLGPLSPPSAPGREQVWHTYPPVPVPSAERAVEALTQVEAWPDYGSEVGRFTPLRERGLAGQTFEIEVVAHPTERTPVFTRGYVTITRLATQAEEPELRAYVAELNDGMRRFGRDEPEPVPEGATPIVGFDLTTHAGHFMGEARNRLLLYEIGEQAYLRAAGTWDPMPWYVGQAYRTAGYEAQQTFWGSGTPEQSMLHQIALATMAPALAPTGHGIPGATSTLSTSEIPGTERPGATGAPSSTGGERPR